MKKKTKKITVESKLRTENTLLKEHKKQLKEHITEMKVHLERYREMKYLMQGDLDFLRSLLLAQAGFKYDPKEF